MQFDDVQPHAFYTNTDYHINQTIISLIILL
jgi:hypothetical protein